MVFFWWTRPSPKDQKACINNCGPFNYDSKYRGASAKPLSTLKEDEDLSRDGFHLNHSRIKLGSGLQTYQKAKAALQSWRHFGLKWAFVDPNSPIEVGSKFCVCVKELVPWVTLPLQVAYVSENRDAKLKSSFGFGGGTLEGHLLAGEERFSIEWDETDEVWYEILSFSKPAHLLSVIGSPYVRRRQKYFAHQSMDAVLKHVTSQQPTL